MADSERCEELRNALDAARARLEPPQRTASEGVQRMVVPDPGDTMPGGTPEVHRQIRQLEQALREAGCED